MTASSIPPELARALETTPSITFLPAASICALLKANNIMLTSGDGDSALAPMLTTSRDVAVIKHRADRFQCFVIGTSRDCVDSAWREPSWEKGDATLYFGSLSLPSPRVRGRPIGRKRKGRSARASSLPMNAAEPQGSPLSTLHRSTASSSASAEVGSRGRRRPLRRHEQI